MRATVAILGLLLAGPAAPAGEAPATDLKPNTWVKAAVDWKSALPADLKDAGWTTGDGCGGRRPS